MNLGPPELLIVVVVVLLVFGPSKLPNLARSLGQAQREFRAGAEGAGSATTSPDAGTDDTIKMTRVEFEALMREWEDGARADARKRE